jgi:serine/threonine protein phosphatase 1
MRRLVIGDIHGAYKALLQVLDRAQFNPEKDQLICLGDVVDGYPQSWECIKFLSQVPNLILIMGNHDFWLMEYIATGMARPEWIMQGGQATLYSIGTKALTPIVKLFEKARKAYVSDDNKVFVHGGLDPHRDVMNQELWNLMWDRDLYMMVADKFRHGKQVDPIGIYDEIYLGHTDTGGLTGIPAKMGNVINLDQGAGYKGKLSVWDVDTGQWWQSDNVVDLYGSVQGQKRR